MNVDISAWLFCKFVPSLHYRPARQVMAEYANIGLATNQIEKHKTKKQLEKEEKHIPG